MSKWETIILLALLLFAVFFIGTALKNTAEFKKDCEDSGGVVLNTRGFNCITKDSMLLQ